MIRINNIPFDTEYTEENIVDKLTKVFSCAESDILSFSVASKSIDARKSREIKFILSFDVVMKNEVRFAEKASKGKYSVVFPFKRKAYSFPVSIKKVTYRPIVVGFGPAGIFCAYLLAKSGYNPIIIERGLSLDEREKSVNEFYLTGKLNTETNIQFGEGGAGAFSDGKLTTLIKDRDSRCSYILDTFVENGAPEDILYVSHPHVGTDLLRNVIKNMRQNIIAMGGEFMFGLRVDRLIIQDNRICGVSLSDGREVETESVFLCVGHSARDTFEMLQNSGITLVRKPFSVGVRIEHLQKDINISRYHDKAHVLPPAEYKAVAHTSNGRALYTFCMCPGGHITAATSEENAVVTNGMSYHARDGENANSALLVSVDTKDINGEGVLDGIEFQRKIEKAAFVYGEGGYKAPVQTVGDLLNNRKTTSFGNVYPTYPRGVTGCNFHDFLPDFITETLKLGIVGISKKIPCFSKSDAVMTAVESRSTCPIRILRDEVTMQASVKGLYPAGEGAGYAGGIMSAASDGMKCAEAYILNR